MHPSLPRAFQQYQAHNQGMHSLGDLPVTNKQNKQTSYLNNRIGRGERFLELVHFLEPPALAHTTLHESHIANCRNHPACGDLPTSTSRLTISSHLSVAPTTT